MNEDSVTTTKKDILMKLVRSINNATRGGKKQVKCRDAVISEDVEQDCVIPIQNEGALNLNFIDPPINNGSQCEQARTPKIFKSRRGVKMVKDLNDVVSKNAIQLIESACVKPSTVILYCKEPESNALHSDLHVSLYKPGINSFATHEGVLYASYYLRGCDSSPYTLHMIVKDDREMSDYQGKNGVAIDFVTTREVLNHLKFTSVFSNLASIPLVIDRPQERFKAGSFAGRYGSFHRRWYSKDIRFYELAKVVSNMIIAGQDFNEVVEFVHHKMTELLTSFKWKNVCKLKDLPSIDQVYSSGPSNRVIPNVDKLVSHFGKHLPTECVDKLPNCISKCCEMKEHRRGLMHGAHVLIDKEKNFLTPCGSKVVELENYWKHPCTVRARAIALQVIEKSDTNSVIQKSTALRDGFPCSACGRRYISKSDAILCAVFCYLVQHGEVVTTSIILPDQLPKVGAFGHSVPKVSIPSALIL